MNFRVNLFTFDRVQVESPYKVFFVRIHHVLYILAEF